MSLHRLHRIPWRSVFRIAVLVLLSSVELPKLLRRIFGKKEEEGEEQ